MLQPGLLIQLAFVSSLEVARVTIGCRQYIFVVTNDHRFISASEMFSGCKHQSHCVCCHELVFHPACRHCLCASVQRAGLQLLEALWSLLTHGFP